jgi:hypothetical protein
MPPIDDRKTHCSGMVRSLHLLTLVMFTGFSRSVAAPVFDTDPTKLLGMSVQNFITAYPSECKKVYQLRAHNAYMWQGLHIPATASDLYASFTLANDDEAVYRCDIKHRSKEIIPGYRDKILQERLYMKDGKIVQVIFETDSGEVNTHFSQVYGRSDQMNLGFEDQSGFGKVEYSDGPYHASVDSSSASYGSFEKWTKCGFLVVLDFHSYESFTSDYSSAGFTAIFRLLEQSELGTIDHRRACSEAK